MDANALRVIKSWTKGIYGTAANAPFAVRSAMKNMIGNKIVKNALYAEQQGSMSTFITFASAENVIKSAKSVTTGGEIAKNVQYVAKNEKTGINGAGANVRFAANHGARNIIPAREPAARTIVGFQTQIRPLGYAVLAE